MGDGQRMMRRGAVAAMAVLLSCLSAAEEKSPKAPRDKIETPPEKLGLDAFYRKYLSAGGIPVVASEKVSDFALREAAYLVGRMLEHRPDVREAMVRAGCRVTVMAWNEYTTDVPEHSRLRPKEFWNWRARGLGGTRECPVVSCGEENLLNYQGDPYPTENIFIHEFGHTLHGLGLVAADKTFQERLEAAYRRALSAGLWKNTYAGENAGEYWAEGVQSWYDTNRSADRIHNGVNTREKLKEYDPGLSVLLAEFLGDGPWRYRRIADRGPEEKRHLAGYDPAAAPRFSWPAELLEIDRRHRQKSGAATRPDAQKEETRGPGNSFQIRWPPVSGGKLPFSCSMLPRAFRTVSRRWPWPPR